MRIRPRATGRRAGSRRRRSSSIARRARTPSARRWGAGSGTGCGRCCSNTTAGIAIISQASPMAQEIAGSKRPSRPASSVSSPSPTERAFPVGVALGLRRRRRYSCTMFLLAGALFIVLPLDSTTVAVLSASVVMLCYGGGFGTMPAFAADFFGPGNVGSIYGLMLTARVPLWLTNLCVSVALFGGRDRSATVLIAPSCRAAAPAPPRDRRCGPCAPATSG